MKIIMALFLTSLLNGTTVKPAEYRKTVDLKVLERYEIREEGYTYETIIYTDKNTGILYMQVNGGLTPILNSDGTYKTEE